MRRSCSIGLVTAPNVVVNDYYWALTTKFKLEIGLLDENSNNIVYFPMGIYVITNFNMNYSTNSYTISIQGKDKMCLINGDVSGEIYASVDFGTIETIDEDGNSIIEDYEIEHIIREAVHEYAMEPFSNIVIKDIPKQGLFLLEYKGSDYMYTLFRISDKKPINYTINPDFQCTISSNPKHSHIGDIVSISDFDAINYMPMNELWEYNINNINAPTTIKIAGSDDEYVIARIAPGQAAGYQLTTLTYPRKVGEKNSGLVSSVGETLTSILDKIVDMLGDYEYFYNLDGQFVFQKRNRSIDTNWNTSDFNTTGLGNSFELEGNEPIAWDFGKGELITSYSNTPNLSNIKNDFSIWGTRTSSSGQEFPIHLRQAIDKKPEIYCTIEATQEEIDAYKKAFPEHTENLEAQETVIYSSKSLDFDDLVINYRLVDWRELIYRMALDHKKFQHWDGFQRKIADANKMFGLYQDGITGYEQYYVDIEGNWRQLYDPDAPDQVEDYERADSSEDVVLYLKDNVLKKNQVNGDYYLNGLSLQTSEYAPCNFWDLETPTIGNNQGYQYRMLKDSDNTQRYGYDLNDLVDDEKFDNLFKYHEGVAKNILVSYPVVKSGNSYYDTGYVAEKGQTPFVVKVKNNNTKGFYDKYGNKIDINTYSYSQPQPPFGPDDDINYITTDDYMLVLPLQKAEWTDILQIDGLYMGKTWQEAREQFYGTGTEPKRLLPNCLYQVYDQILAIGSGVYKSLELRSDGAVIKDEPDKKFYQAAYFNGVLWKLPVITYNQLCSNMSFNLSSFYTLSLQNGVVKPVQATLSDKLIDRYEFVDLDDQMRIRDISPIEQYPYQNRTPENIVLFNLDRFNDRASQFFNMKFIPIQYYKKIQKYNNVTDGWNNIVRENPECLNFWFDFLDSQTSEVGKYGANIIQDRSKATTDDNAKAIYYRPSMEIIYLTGAPEEERLLSYITNPYTTFDISQSAMSMFNVMRSGKSCKDVLDEYLYKFTYANETVNLTTIPIYHLEPGNRILLQDSNTLIGGQYVINSISIPLTYNGTMSINATKEVPKLY